MERESGLPVDVTEYEKISSVLKDKDDVYAVFRKREDKETLWAAAKYVNGEPDTISAFSITYDQAKKARPLLDESKKSSESFEFFGLYRHVMRPSRYAEVFKGSNDDRWINEFSFPSMHRADVKKHIETTDMTKHCRKVSIHNLSRILKRYNLIDYTPDKEDSTESKK